MSVLLNESNFNWIKLGHDFNLSVEIQGPFICFTIDGCWIASKEINNEHYAFSISYKKNVYDNSSSAMTAKEIKYDALFDYEQFKKMLQDSISSYKKYLIDEKMKLINEDFTC